MCDEIYKQLISITNYRPKIAIICGTGLGGLVESITDKFSVSYADIQGFPRSTVRGHDGNLVFGRLGNKEVVFLQGRCHPYEGYSTQTCTISLRVLRLMGARVLIVTNAAGGLNENYKAGDMMIIKDHINLPGLSGLNPLVGYNGGSFDEAFIPLSDSYDKEFMSLAKNVALSLAEDVTIHEGVYAMQTGPAFETVAECRMMLILGADAVGMSTTHEVIVARHVGMRVFGLSLITNECIVTYDTDKVLIDHEVYAVSSKRSASLQKLIYELVQEMNLVV